MPNIDAGGLRVATLTVDADTIRAYADLTDDFNPIHLDPAFAAGTPLGGVIAHGTMSICLLWQAIFLSLGETALTDMELDIRFVRPVRIGETLSASGRRVDGGAYDVWVRAGDGSDRLAGTLRPVATG